LKNTNDNCKKIEALIIEIDKLNKSIPAPSNKTDENKTPSLTTSKTTTKLIKDKPIEKK